MFNVLLYRCVIYIQCHQFVLLRQCPQLYFARMQVMYSESQRLVASSCCSCGLFIYLFFYRCTYSFQHIIYYMVWSPHVSRALTFEFLLSANIETKVFHSQKQAQNMSSESNVFYDGENMYVQITPLLRNSSI